jgi:hypothetical protein
MSVNTPPSGPRSALSARNLATVAAILALGASSLAACKIGNVTRESGSAPPQLLGGESPAEVQSRWGKPDRTMSASDKQTGHEQTFWVYERFVDSNGSSVITTLTFDGGKVARIERTPRPQSVAAPAPDTAARRDME